MLQRSAFGLLLVSLVFTGVGAAFAVPYYLTDLGPVGSDTISLAYGVASVGGSPVAVGFSQLSPGVRTPVRWSSNGTGTSLLGSIPGATVGTAEAIAPNGDVAGIATVGGAQKAFYLPNGGTATILPDLGSGSPASFAAGLNSSGMVVGYSYGTDGLNHAVAWPSSGGIIDLGLSGSTVGTYATTISADGNTIVGDYNDTPGQQGQACKWTKSGSTWTMSTIVPLSTYNQSVALSINSSGDIVGSCFNYPSGGFPNPDVQAIMVKHDGTVIKLGGIGTGWLFSYAYGINDSGVIVGSASTTGPAWVNYTGTADANISLNSLLAPSAAGWNLYAAYGIDNNGNITGKAKNPAGIYHGFLLKPAMQGDANLDAVVDISDLSPVLTNYGKTGMQWADGDFTGDGSVSIDDLSPTLTNYGKSAGAGPHAVPEPSTLLLVASGLLALVICAGRKRK